MNPILKGAPWLIAHRSMLGINRPYKITLNGSDYVIWQNDQGEISALDNICPHLQAPLSNGWICKSRNSIVCPYHALEFDREGRLLKTFPSTTLFKAKIPLGELRQFFILYPETENRTRTFVLSYANWKSPLTKVPVIKNLIERSLVESTAKIVEQDSSAVESLYPRQKPKIRLPKEEIMTYVEELYYQWE
ncbi:Rieske (2Fe-2S) protein [Pleurocapsa sp. PCC 7319]|uniref:Rieske (2Fe-2S) protein n=1 Tax=Pleurocapsa sp. PCC 7319 TaxID=118161 RepID=UPI00034DA6EE|nr:Rieske (2Fe-2S) protein [Pleurocapsa sp. PCC 7319]